VGVIPAQDVTILHGGKAWSHAQPGVPYRVARLELPQFGGGRPGLAAAKRRVCAAQAVALADAFTTTFQAENPDGAAAGRRCRANVVTPLRAIEAARGGEFEEVQSGGGGGGERDGGAAEDEGQKEDEGQHH